MIKIISWNVNSINVRKEQIYDLLKTHAPDFLCIQEMKTLNYEDPYLEELGYNIFYNGEKSYNGVAIIVKKTIKPGEQLTNNNIIIKYKREEIEEIRDKVHLIVKRSGVVLQKKNVKLEISHHYGVKKFYNYEKVDRRPHH